jgi:hypothetical protein
MLLTRIDEKRFFSLQKNSHRKMMDFPSRNLNILIDEKNRTKTTRVANDGDVANIDGS